jgi:hypothetical protein
MTIKLMGGRLLALFVGLMLGLFISYSLAQQQIPTYAGAYPGQSAGTTNGATKLTSFATGEGTNTVTTSAAALTAYSGTAPASAIYVICTNAGSNDAWVSPLSGGHTLLVPAGSTVYVPFGSTPLYSMAVSGTTTVYCLPVGY